MTDKIKGGLADNMSLQDIADKHNVTLSAIEEQFAMGIKVEREHTDSDEQAEEIAKDHLFEMPDYYSKLEVMEKQNAIGYTRPVKIQTHSVKNGDEWAKTYIAAGFIEKGVCTYNEETILLEQETLLNAIHTMKGRPIVIKHQKVTPENMKEFAKGYTSAEGEFNPITASFDVPFLVFDEEGKQKIDDGWSVSCAYIPKAFKEGGTWHNTPYDREVTDLEFTHLALVPDPRYEDAKIYENSKSDNNDNTKENYNMEKIEVEQGFLASLIALAQKPFLNAKEDDEKKEDDDELEYEGKKYSKKELINCYKAKQNEMAKEADDKKAEEHEAKETKKEEKEEHEEKKNSISDEDMEFFNSMQAKMAAAQTDANDKIVVHSQNEGLELGKKAFG